MSTEPTESNFDPEAIAAALVGTWSFPVDFPVVGKSTGIGLIHFTSSGRAIQFVFNPQESDKLVPMRLWYSIESPTHLRFRPNPAHEGWLRGHRFDSGTVILAAKECSWACTRPSPEEIPDWFQQALDSALAEA